MEWENSSSSHCIRQKGIERHWDKIRCAKSRNVSGSHVLGKVTRLFGAACFKLRVNNQAFSWLKTYSIDQSYIGRWIVRLDGYHMIIEHTMREKHQNADSLSKKTEVYEG